MKRRFYLATKKDDEWVKTDKRGFGDQEIAEINAKVMSNRNGGLLVGVMHNGKIISEFFKGVKNA